MRQIADSFPKAVKAADDGPCDGCRHYDRCTAETICCEAFVPFVRLECGPDRWRSAPRRPNAAIMERLGGGAPRRLSQASANLYSLVMSCRANEIEPYAYLNYLFEHLPAVTTVAQVEALLPWNVKVMLDEQKKNLVQFRAFSDS